MEAEKLLARLANSLDSQERINTLKKYGTAVPEDLVDLIFIHLDLYVAEKNFELAEELLRIGEELAKVNEEPFFAYQLYKKRAKVEEEKGDYAKAHEVYEDLIKLSKRIEREDIEAEILMESGILYEKQGFCEEALERFLKASAIYKRLGHHYNYAASLFNIAYIYYDKGELDASIEYCQQALDVDDGEKFSSLEAHVNLEFANIYESKKEIMLSKLFYQKALDGYQKNNDKVKASDIVYKLGALLHQEKKIPLSLEHYQRALDMKMDLDYTQALAKYYFMRGRVYKDSGLQLKAARYLDKAYYLYSLLGQEKQCMRVKFLLHSILCRTDERIISLPEFMRNYKVPQYKDNNVDRASKGVYIARKSDGGKLGYYRHNEGKGSFIIERKVLSSLLRDLSRAYYLDGNSQKYKQYSQQFKVVKEFKTEKK